MQNLESIAISIAKIQKYCKISKVLQQVLQYFESIAILIAKSQSIAISIAKFQKYCNSYCNTLKVLQ